MAALFPPDSGCRKGRKWPWQAGSAPDHQGRGQQEPPTKTMEGARTKSIQMKEKESEAAAGAPAPPFQVKSEAPVLPAVGAGTRGVRGGRPAPQGTGSSRKSASLAPPPGQPPPPCPSGLPVWARLSDPGQRGLGRPGALGPGEAAHLAVAGARLVHEGAVLTGPHGGRGSVRGTPNSAVLVEAGKLHPNCACGRGEKRVSIISAQDDSRPLGLFHSSE